MSNIRVELQLEDGSFVSGVRRAGQSLADFRRELARTDPHFRELAEAGHGGFLSMRRADEQTRSFGQTLRNVTYGLGAATLAFSALSGASSGTVGNLVRINAEMEKLRYQMAGMSDAADPMKEAAEQVASLQAMATSTPFALGALSNSFVKLKAAGIDPTNGSLKALTDGLAAFGASDEQLNRVTVALTQMQGKGVLSMEELRQQLGESMPNAMRLMARSMGVSVGELSKMVSTGTVESKAALDKWFREVQLSYSGTGEMMMQTFSGQMARLRTALTQQITSGETAKAFERLKGIIGDVADFMGTIEAAEMFDALGRGLQAAMTFGEGFVTALREIKDVLLFLQPVLPYVFGGAVLLAGAGRMSVAMRKMRTDWEDIRLSAAKTRMELQGTLAASTAAATAAAGGTAAAAAAASAAAGTSAVAASTSAMAAGSAFSRFLGPMTSVVALGARFLGFLGPIALGLSILAPIALTIGKSIWGWVTGAEKADEKLESIAEGRLREERQIQAEEKKSLQARIDNLMAEEDAYVDKHGKNNAWRLKQLEKLHSQLAAMEKRHAESTGDLEEKVIDERVQASMKRIATAGREASADYNRDMNDSERRYLLEEAAAMKAGASVRAIREKFDKEETERRKQRLNEEIGFHDDEIAALEKQGGDQEAVIAKILERRRDLVRQRDELSPEQLTVETLTAPVDDSKKEARLQRFFNSARDKVEELTAELNGASGAVSKLAFQIRRGDFGRLENGTEAAEKMRDALLATSIAAEALDEIMKGGSAAHSEITRIYENLVEENLKLEAKLGGVNTDDALAMFEWKKANGHLEGLADTAENTVVKAIDKVTEGVNLSFTSFDELANQIRENAFGPRSVEKIDVVAEALGRVRGQLDGITGSVSALDFGRMGAPTVFAKGDGGIKDLIAGVESGGDYNATLDNGRWTGGAQNLTGMSLRNVYALQQRMLANPENRAKYGDGKGSSALGKYQIVSKTLKGLVDEMGLDWDAKFDATMQDRMADHLLSRRGRNPAALRQEWEGLNRVSDADILAAWDRSTTGPTNLAAATQPAPTSAPVKPASAPSSGSSVISQAVNAVRSLDGGAIWENMISGAQKALDNVDETLAKAQGEQQRNVSLTAQAYVKDTFGDINQSKASATDEEGGDARYGKLGRKVRADRASGDVIGVSEDEWNALVKAADAEDQRLEKLKERTKLQKEADENTKKMNEELIEIDQRRSDALKQANNPNYQAQSSELTNLLKLEREQLEIVGKIHGVNSEEYNSEKTRLAAQRRAIQGAESAEALVELTRAAEESEKSAITRPNEQRKLEFDERMKELAALRDRAIADGALVAEAQKAYDRAVAAEKKRLLDDQRNSMETAISEMARLEQNLNAKGGDWARSLSDTIYDWASGGEGGWSNLGNKIREDIAKSMIDKGTSFILKPFEKALGDGDGEGGIGGVVDKFTDKLVKDFTPKEGEGIFSGLTGGLTSMLRSTMTGISGFMKSMFNKSGFFPVKHTGGIVGRSGGWGRSAPVSAFAGAPKFHTGGIVGKPNLRKGLSPSEVPIIAQKGEGVFTPEQMKHLGGTVNSNAVSINAPITVNANGGTPEQNSDLAQQMAREAETMFRGIVQQEMVRQLRPGGLMR